MEDAKPPRISVVIPARNEERRIGRCLAALAAQSLREGEFEVVVVDDGSTDETAVVSEAGGAIVVRTDGGGAGGARNRGIRESSGALVFLLDADCVPGPRWAEELARPFEDGAVAGAVGLITSDQRSLVASYVQLGYEDRYERLGEGLPTDFIPTANCAFRRQILVEYPFDETFKRLEDVELSFRLTRAGLRLVFVSGARASHPHPERLWTLMRRQYGYARYALPLYREHPEKAVSDSSTPHSRRGRVLTLALALGLVPVALFVPPLWILIAGLAVLSVAFSLPVIVRAFRVSPRLGLVAPYFLFATNLAFVLGAISGLLPGKTRQMR